MTPAPQPRASWIVIPALDEADRIGDCLEAVRRAAARVDGPVHVVVVDDGSSDATADLARRQLRGWPGQHAVVDGPGRGVGPARGLGLERALVGAMAEPARAGRPDALIATTDADSAVEPSWIGQMHELLDDGHVVIAGDILLAEPFDRDVARARERRLIRRVAELPADERPAPHPHFAGASLGFAAPTLQSLWPLPTPRTLEDEAWLRRCRSRGVAVHRDGRVRVATSARLDGRAPGGLAAALSADAAALRGAVPSATGGDRDLPLATRAP